MNNNSYLRVAKNIRLIQYKKRNEYIQKINFTLYKKDILKEEEVLMKMNKRQFRIGELAQFLNVERFVVRFWEKEFNVHSSRSKGGQRFYQEKDLKTFTKIKELLYDKKFTIAGAKEALKSGKNSSLFASKTTMESSTQKTIALSFEQLCDMRKKLIALRELL